MKLKIRETTQQEQEETLELWLEQDEDGTVKVLSRKDVSNRICGEFLIFPNGSWVKVPFGNLNK